MIAWHKGVEHDPSILDAFGVVLLSFGLVGAFIGSISLAAYVHEKNRFLGGAAWTIVVLFWSTMFVWTLMTGMADS